MADPYAAFADPVGEHDPYAGVADVVHDPKDEAPEAAPTPPPGQKFVGWGYDSGDNNRRYPMFGPDDKTKAIEKLSPGSRPGLTDKIVHGMTLGLDTEADGLVTAVGNAIAHPVETWQSGGQSFADAYSRGRQDNIDRLDYVENKHPFLAPAADVGGMILNPIGSVGEGLKGMAAGGAIVGGVHGFESGNGSVGERLKDAGEEAAVSAVAAPVLGKVAEYAIRGGSKIAGAASRLLGKDDTVGTRLVAKKLAEDNLSPTDLGTAMSAANRNGTPAMAADMGENLRSLGGSVSRQPGAARNIAKTATEERQLGQGERLKDAINRDLGHTTDVLEESERLMKAAKAKAGPLYEKAYAQPTNSEAIQGILRTPAGKAALQRAHTIAANEGVDPLRMGVDLNAQGEVVLTKVPTAKTLDYVKRGMDDIIEGYRDKTTGKLSLDESGRAINGVKQRLLAEMDRLNPDYKAARKAFAGPAQLREAMMDGKKALNKSASEINQRLTQMTEPEREQYALGLRSAIADHLDTTGDNANKVRQLIGNPKKRQALQRVFGGKADLDRFFATMENERKAFDTYAAVHRGSPTAERMGEDSNNSDMKLLKALGSDLSALKDGKSAVAARLGERAVDAFKFGVGKTGQSAREDAAALLFTSDPSEFANALAQMDSRIASRKDFTNALADIVRRRTAQVGSAGGAVAANALAKKRPK